MYFYDSSLDRISDGALLGGLLVFYSVASPLHSVPMVVISLLAILGTFLTSYTRARAESLGIDAKVGLMQRPERVVLLSAPQAFFGLAFDGWVLAGIITLLCVTSWITAVQRMQFVYRQTLPISHPTARTHSVATGGQKEKSELAGAPAAARAQSPQ